MSNSCDLMDGSLPSSSVHRILQARILEWVAISFSRGYSNPGIKPVSPALAGGFFTTEPPRKPEFTMRYSLYSLGGFRKGRGTRDQIANIHWIMGKAREFQKNIYFCFIDYVKAFDCVDHKKLENSERDGNTRPPNLPLEKSVCRSGSNS